MTPNPISIPSDARGFLALGCLQDPQLWDEPPGELLLQAKGLKHADAYTGAALRATLETHHRRGGETCLWSPSVTSIRNRLASLLGPLPNWVKRPGDEGTPTLDRTVLCPAITLATPAAIQLAAEGVRAAGFVRRLKRGVAHTLGQAVLALAENALVHAGGSPCDAILCAALEKDAAQVVVVDQSQAVAAAGDSAEILREGLAKPAGGLAYVRALAEERYDLEVSVSLAAGTARGYRPGRTYSEQVFVPGFCAGLTVEAAK